MTAGEPPKRPRPGLFVELMRRRYYYQTDENDLTEELDANPAAGWIYGVLGAGTIVAYWTMCLVQGYGWILNPHPKGMHRHEPLLAKVEGPTAFWLAWAIIGLGLMLHFHSFWGTHRKLSRYHEIPWFAALSGTLFFAGMLAYHVLRNMRL